MTGAAWLSYSLQDVVMFGPEVFLRLFVRINRDIWPWQFLILPLTLAVPWLTCRPEPGLRRLAWFILAAAWITSGYVFLVGYFGEINWPASWFGWGFVAQGLMLAVLALVIGLPPLPKGRAGPLILSWMIAVVLLPWVSVMQAGDVKALALFGLVPGITVAASALLLALPGRASLFLLWPVPVMWVLFSAATYWALQTFWLLLVPLATPVFMALGVWLSPSSARSQGPQSARRDPARR